MVAFLLEESIIFEMTFCTKIGLHLTSVFPLKKLKNSVIYNR